MVRNAWFDMGRLKPSFTIPINIDRISTNAAHFNPAAAGFYP